MKRLPFSVILNWRLMFMRLLMYGLMVLGTAALVPQIYFNPFTITNVLIVALIFGILNAILRPLIQLLTFSLLFATYGILVILVNTVLLLFLSRIVPIFYVDNFWWALIGGAVIGLIGSFLENLLGLTLPILPEKDASLKQEMARRISRIERITRPEPVQALPVAQSDALPVSGTAEPPIDRELEVAALEEVSEQQREAKAIMATIETYENQDADVEETPPPNEEINDQEVKS
jgi:putative membrane protein